LRSSWWKFHKVPDRLRLLLVVLATGVAVRASAVPFELGTERSFVKIWGNRGAEHRFFFDEFLPSLFSRSITLSTLGSDRELWWIFTGDHGGVTVRVRARKVTVVLRYYDSFAFNSFRKGAPARHPEWSRVLSEETLSRSPERISVSVDHKLTLKVSVDGREICKAVLLLDLTRHQLRLFGPEGAVRGHMTAPDTVSARVTIDPSKQFQTMIGFGGITSPPAFNQLSRRGKDLWWKYLREYNLLIQREYPNGRRLNRRMDNRDRLQDATPHYYGDNFPNGEITDFEYNRKVKEFGGQVWFEFWDLPPWVGKDIGLYTKAVVGYCEEARRRGGGAPDIVGIQNEKRQPEKIWHEMAVELRRALDRAGFRDVKIHMTDAGTVSGGIRRAEAFLRSPAAWRAVDYAAVHMYDYQSFFTDPGGFDSTLRRWRELTRQKPFLSTELCINRGAYQHPSYRLALTMGQLYHKNLVLCDACAICYCWTLLNVLQPTYGETRSLFVVDRRNGFVPAPSSFQLRVFAAISRRIRRGMRRTAAQAGDPDLLVSAFGDGDRAGTAVLLNRSTRPIRAEVKWPGLRLRELEVTDQYHANEVRPADDSGVITVEPGAVVTASFVRTGGSTGKRDNKNGGSCVMSESGSHDDSREARQVDRGKLKKKLSPLSYHVTCECGTEPPFKNAYWDNKRPGIYVDVISGKPLFSSLEKYDSGTGWPSFTAPLDPGEIVEKIDTSLGRIRTEVRARTSDAHLGHVFEDGPPPTGRRYCINSAALRFIPVEDLEKEGYGEYLRLFKEEKGGKKARKLETALFGAGCFWGVEAAFRKVPGVVDTEVGYAGGTVENPTYEQVCTDKTGHAEVVRVVYDPAEVSYEELLEVFGKIHDPTQLNRQGPDVGRQYRSVIFFFTPEQEAAARTWKKRTAESGRRSKPVVTEISPAPPFYRAEEYHQRYLEKKGSPSCGR